MKFKYVIMALLALGLAVPTASFAKGSHHTRHGQTLKHKKPHHHGSKLTPGNG